MISFIYKGDRRMKNTKTDKKSQGIKTTDTKKTPEHTAVKENPVDDLNELDQQAVNKSLMDDALENIEEGAKIVARTTVDTIVDTAGKVGQFTQKLLAKTQKNASQLIEKGSKTVSDLGGYSKEYSQSIKTKKEIKKLEAIQEDRYLYLGKRIANESLTHTGALNDILQNSQINEIINELKKNDRKLTKLRKTVNSLSE